MGGSEVLESIIKDIYIRPGDILKTFRNRQGQYKLRPYLYWGYIVNEEMRTFITKLTKQEHYNSGVLSKVAIQSYYKFVTLEIVNKKSIEAPAVVYYRVFYPSVIEKEAVDLSINSEYVDIPCGINLVSSSSQFAGPCIITYVERRKIAPECANFITNGILPRNLEGTVYLREYFDNIYIYTKHKKTKIKTGNGKLVVKEGKK